MKLLHALQYAWMNDYPAFYHRKSFVIPARLTNQEVQQAAMSAAEEKRQRRALRNKRIATQERKS